MSGEKLCFAGIMLCLQLLFSAVAQAQLSEAAKSAVLISSHYDVLPNITYGVAVTAPFTVGGARARKTPPGARDARVVSFESVELSH